MSSYTTQLILHATSHDAPWNARNGKENRIMAAKGGREMVIEWTSQPAIKQIDEDEAIHESIPRHNRNGDENKCDD